MRSRTQRGLAVLLALGITIGMVGPVGAVGDRVGHATAGANTGSDFNGDGFADLAIGAPRSRVGAVANAGAVQVLYGSASGLSAEGNQLWSQDSPGVLGSPESGDGFGQALATGDFNGDGKDDLAIGIPLDTIGTTQDAGSVQVLYGSVGGLTATDNRIFSLSTASVPGIVEALDRFGASVAAGDVNGDGRDDLAVAVPGKTVGGDGDAGVVVVLPGSSGGLTGTGSQMWSQDSAGVAEDAEAQDYFGHAVTMGDFNGDGRADLAVGVIGETAGNKYGAGAVSVLYGSPTGLSSAGNQLWHAGQPGVPHDPETLGSFGYSLAAGDFDDDGRSDLAVSSATGSVGSVSFAGNVYTFPGGVSGLKSTGIQVWHQDRAGVLGSAAENDQFGAVLATGNFDATAGDDLAIGIPNEDVGSAVDAGSVQVLYAGSGGLTTTGNQLWSMATPGIPSNPGTDNRFGAGLASADFDGDGDFDLAIGIPYRRVAGFEEAGAVVELLEFSPTATSRRFWTQETSGIVGDPYTRNNFGATLAAGGTGLAK